MVNNHIEIARQSLELCTTIEEGLEHISGRFDSGFYEDAFVLYQDVVQAFFTIQQAIAPLSDQLSANNLASLAQSVQDSMSQIVSAYEQKNWNMARDTLQNHLLPAWIEWKQELESIFKSYVAS